MSRQTFEVAPDRVALRWRVRSKARRALVTASSLRRVQLCGHQALGNLVSLRRGAHGADYGKVAVCGSVWACPVCSARILAERTSEVAQGFEVWQATGGTVGMATLTVRHNKSQSLKDVWGVVGKAWSRMTSGRPWGRITDRMGLAGWLRTAEVTHGANGWHLHLHVLLFLDGSATGTDFDIASGLLLERWAASVAAVGGSVVARAQDVRVFVDPQAGDLAYFAKAYYGGSDSAAFEVTRSDLKRGAGRSPFEILEAAVESGTDIGPDWALWREFERASHRKRMHTWSRGMRAALGLDVERTDEEIAEDESAMPETETVGWITRSAWSRVRASDALYWALLDAVADGGLPAALAWGARHKIDVLPPGAERNFYCFHDADMPKGYKLG